MPLRQQVIIQSMRVNKMNREEKNNHGMKHMIMMALACVIPLVLIFMLPFFGISSKWTSVGAIGLMIFLHVLMMKDHFKGGGR